MTPTSPVPPEQTRCAMCEGAGQFTAGPDTPRRCDVCGGTGRRPASPQPVAPAPAKCCAARYRTQGDTATFLCSLLDGHANEHEAWSDRLLYTWPSAPLPATEGTTKPCPRWGTCFSHDCTCHPRVAAAPQEDGAGEEATLTADEKIAAYQEHIAALEAQVERHGTATAALRFDIEMLNRATQCQADKATEYYRQLKESADDAAALRAQLAEAERREREHADELREIDATLGNPLALERHWSRSQKIAHMLRMLQHLNAPAALPASPTERPTDGR